MTQTPTLTPAETLATLAISWLLVGLILTVHFIHYPSFRYADTQWAAAHQFHTGAISLLVGPLMVVELALALWVAQKMQWQASYLLPLGIVVLIWGNTFLQAVPLHNALAAGHDLRKIDQLVRVDGIRTVLWVIKAAWVSWLFLRS